MGDHWIRLTVLLLAVTNILSGLSIWHLINRIDRLELMIAKVSLEKGER